MRKQLLVLAIVVGLAGLLTLGCNGTQSSSQSSSPGSGSVAIFGGDAPLCGVASFVVDITDATVTPEDGGSPVSIIPPGQPIKNVDFAALMDFFTVLNLSSVPQGTYTKITLTLSNPRLTVLDTTQSPPKPVPVNSVTLTNTTITIPIHPSLNVTANGTAALTLDFKLRRSLQIQAGQVTGMVNPVITASSQGPRNRDDENGEDHHQELGDDEDLKGTVKSVSTTGSKGFTGSFTVDTQVGNMPVVEVNSNTKFNGEGVTDLSHLATGSMVQVDAFVDSNGFIVARKVEVEGEEDNDHLAFMGMITAINKSDSSGNVQQFTMFVRHESAEATGCLLPRSNLMVNVTSSTKYRIIASGLNRANLAFDASALGLGQEIGVFGQCKTGQTSPTVDALGIFLRPQTVLCNFKPPLLHAESDGKTGGFAMIPCSAVFNGETMTVLTFAQTAFAGVSDLNGLTSGPTLGVKGLLLYEPKSITVNGVSITGTPAMPAAAMEAKQVHQFGDDD